MYTIKLRRQNHSLSLKRVVSPIRLRHAGVRGLPGVKGDKGDQGEPGAGVAAGGFTGQVLVKNSEQNYDTQWTTFEGSDKTYTQSFTVTNEVIVTHNLNKYPSVTVIDSSDEEVEGQIDYINTNQLIVNFSLPFSGRVICN